MMTLITSFLLVVLGVRRARHEVSCRLRMLFHWSWWATTINTEAGQSTLRQVKKYTGHRKQTACWGPCFKKLWTWDTLLRVCGLFATHTRLSLELFMGMIGNDACAWSVLANLKEMTGLISGVYMVTTMMWLHQIPGPKSIVHAEPFQLWPSPQVFAPNLLARLTSLGLGGDQGRNRHNAIGAGKRNQFKDAVGNMSL